MNKKEIQSQFSTFGLNIQRSSNEHMNDERKSSLDVFKKIMEFDCSEQDYKNMDEQLQTQNKIVQIPNDPLQNQNYMLQQENKRLSYQKHKNEPQIQIFNENLSLIENEQKQQHHEQLSNRVRDSQETYIKQLASDGFKEKSLGYQEQKQFQKFDKHQQQNLPNSVSNCIINEIKSQTFSQSPQFFRKSQVTNSQKKSKEFFNYDVFSGQKLKTSQTEDDQLIQFLGNQQNQLEQKQCISKQEKKDSITNKIMPDINFYSYQQLPFNQSNNDFKQQLKIIKSSSDIDYNIVRQQIQINQQALQDKYKKDDKQDDQSKDNRLLTVIDQRNSLLQLYEQQSQEVFNLQNDLISQIKEYEKVNTSKISLEHSIIKLTNKLDQLNTLFQRRMDEFQDVSKAFLETQNILALREQNIEQRDRNQSEKINNLIKSNSRDKQDKQFFTRMKEVSDKQEFMKNYDRHRISQQDNQKLRQSVFSDQSDKNFHKSERSQTQQRDSALMVLKTEIFQLEEENFKLIQELGITREKFMEVLRELEKYKLININAIELKEVNHTLSQELAKTRERLQDVTRQLNEQNNEGTINQQIVMIERKIQLTISENDRLKKYLGEKNQEIENLNTQIQNLNKQISQLQQKQNSVQLIAPVSLGIKNQSDQSNQNESDRFRVQLYQDIENESKDFLIESLRGQLTQRDKEIAYYLEQKISSSNDQIFKDEKQRQIINELRKEISQTGNNYNDAGMLKNRLHNQQIEINIKKNSQIFGIEQTFDIKKSFI